MDFEVLYSLDNEEQFWEELDDIVSVQCQSYELIDNVLRSYLAFTSEYKGEYLRTEYDFARCSFKLLESPVFASHKDYVRMQIVNSILQEDSADTLHLLVAFLLFDGRQNEKTFGMMNEEGVFPRLVELIQEEKDDDTGLHRMLLQLLYEMSRIQRLRTEDLILIQDDFIAYLFNIIEGLSDDVNDPYHYPVIRVLLILNEQYMVLANDPGPNHPPTTHLTNKVIKILSLHGSAYKTFGENIILLLNRESETSLQLLILKLLYLLFTTPPTYEYFYTNDLRVLVDVIIRNLLDLPISATALRHTYLRVLSPLLAHTQLQYPPHYKREEIRRLLAIMVPRNGGGGGVGGHFGAVDETTERLVGRCGRVTWLGVEDDDSNSNSPNNGTTTKNGSCSGGFLAVEMPRAMTSALSMTEVTTLREKPGVQTPSLGKGGSRFGSGYNEDVDGNVDGGEVVVGGAKIEGKSPFDGDDEGEM